MKIVFIEFVRLFVAVVILKQSCCKLFVDNILEKSDHEVLNDDRVVIDAAISPSHVESMMEIVRKSPMLMKKNPVHKYSNVEVAQHEFRSAGDVKLELQAKVKSLKFPKNTNISISKTIRIQEDFMNIEPLIIDYAEAFYKKKFKVFTSVLFVRTHLPQKVIPEHSPIEVNNAAGWLVQTHVDGCLFSPADWTCSMYGFSHIATDYIYRDVSAVLFLNDLKEDGGEFVFIDPSDRKVRMINPDAKLINDLEMARKNGTDEVKNLSGGLSEFDPNRRALRERIGAQTDAGSESHENRNSNTVRYESIPPPPRHQVRRALKDQKKRASGSFSVAPGKYSKIISVPSKNVNYTMVIPKSRRLLLFNASKENVHAVTQIINQNDRRYTWFLSLTVVRD